MKKNRGRTKNMYPFSCEDYIIELVKRIPIAIIGGCTGVLFNIPRIRKASGRIAKICLIASEWGTGAFFAAMTSFLLPLLIHITARHFDVEPVTLDIQTEIGVCGFLGGTCGVRLYKKAMRKIFGIETE